MEAVQTHKVHYCFKSLLADRIGNTLMVDKANEIRLPRTGEASIFLDRDLDEFDPINPHRIAAMARITDAFMPIQGHAPLIVTGNFPVVSKPSSDRSNTSKKRSRIRLRS